VFNSLFNIQCNGVQKLKSKKVEINLYGYSSIRNFFSYGQPIARRNKQICDYDFTNITEHCKNNVTISIKYRFKLYPIIITILFYVTNGKHF